MDGGQEPLTGRARVRAMLIDPLEAGGMRKLRNVSADDHKQSLAKLADKVGYLSDRGLAALRDYAIKMGGDGQVWPRLNVLLQAAWAIEPMPVQKSPFAQSLLQSRLGVEARDGGWHVELYSDALRMRPPPNDYGKRVLADRAAANAHRAAVIGEQVQRGVAREADLSWLRGYERVGREALAFIEQGVVARKGKGVDDAG